MSALTAGVDVAGGDDVREWVVARLRHIRLGEREAAVEAEVSGSGELYEAVSDRLPLGRRAGHDGEAVPAEVT